MLSIEYDAEHGCFVVEPSGHLSSSDFEDLTERFNTKVNESDTIPNLVFHASGFPGWADLAGFMSHMKFIGDHEKLIAKIALVADSHLLDVGPAVAKHFVLADIRHFPFSDLQSALDWVAEEDPENITVIEGLPSHVVGLSAHGVISARDYQNVIVPLIERKLDGHKTINLLYNMGSGFESFTPGAAWSDLRLGMMNLSRFSKVALVTDVSWIRNATRVFAPLMPGELNVFTNADLDVAKSWVSAK